ncbi:hypothetical protein MTR67_033096 [Solanum verrucosum]|uniref:Uncharacterized protein n=1 Tax=Solanum verrucosum TaxID=315347 RepID=A0AAF0U5S5_SOLVR|nr:hypothetical protein MTR67_033096 [Solanum verrucosum]
MKRVECTLTFLLPLRGNMLFLIDPPLQRNAIGAGNVQGPAIPLISLKHLTSEIAIRRAGLRITHVTGSKFLPFFSPQAYVMLNAGAVRHSHGMESCLVTMLNPPAKESR